MQRITGAPLTASAGGGLRRLIAACAWFQLGSCRAGCRVYFGKVAKPLWAFVTERTSGFVLSQGNGLAGAASTEPLQEGRLAGAAEVDRYRVPAALQAGRCRSCWRYWTWTVRALFCRGWYLILKTTPCVSKRKLGLFRRKYVRNISFYYLILLTLLAF